MQVFGAKGGVIVSLERAASDPRPLSRLLAHEIGHYLGLYHTSEAVFDAHDPLDDTPLDEDSFLMHAIPQGDQLSPEQAGVMRRNPHVRAP